MESAVFDLKIEKAESLPGEEGSSASLKPFGDWETKVEPDRLSIVSLVLVSEIVGVGVRSTRWSLWCSRWSSSDKAGDEKSMAGSSNFSNLMNFCISSDLMAIGLVAVAVAAGTC
ncbi:hypothetical protein OGAPHI_003336 [Ogataea philodendri]|uniref:Uncharacterized protein n=1 Tax=Ogataea philodendri TaxID=1378263 RepID=A0A9P8T5K5_9ASCO|nr:uncharacterized protein OGAPHI_003336 [Ogataea philodendri]KAH3666886.1 hypothetical protein OGAPHI_003336 [Ogataea philodendri]